MALKDSTPNLRIHVYIHIYIYMVPPPVIYLFLGCRAKASSTLRAQGFRVKGFWFRKQTSIEVQYSVLNFNTVELQPYY